MFSASRSRLALPVLGIALAIPLVASASAVDRSTREPAASTSHFAFHSDFATNLADRLIASGLARSEGEPEPFSAGAEADCLAELPDAERAAWHRAVDYFAEIVSPADARGPRTLLRLHLAGIVAEGEWDEPAEARFVAIADGFLQAAGPAYRACRWPQQDRQNRDWLQALEPRLASHGQGLADRLSQIYQTPWRGLPIRVDLVETVNWAGAHTINLRPPDAAHIQISTAPGRFPEAEALEIVFHEASHFLAGRGSAVSDALAAATDRFGNPFRGNLVHAVQFYLTGEVVRRTLAAAGQPGYTPYLYAHGLYEGGVFRGAAESTLPAYLEGRRTLEEAAADLVRALAGLR